MSPTATTHVQLYSETPTMTSLRLRGDNVHRYHQQWQLQQQPTGLSPLDSPQLVGFNNGSPYQMAIPTMDYFDRSQAPPPMERMACIPLPRIGGGPLNPVLERTPLPMILYNIAQTSDCASMNPRQREALRHSFDEPATIGGATSVTIQARFLPWPIVVQRNGAVITVRDVLSSVHSALRRLAQNQGLVKPDHHILSPDHYSTIPNNHYEPAILASILGGRCTWDGLTASPKEPEVWILHIR
ncbi:hypothetical protein CC1G_07459 [Coprinopsis cinerea okayama7|uniref:DUF6699 domain-containing protein n=1 Tax=Coprinopsis cinerea (strain Okayama-7 / 130 / ATCC MYA-4618 / FGSC 9003) TaxID=240176 RepID=A8NB89_COPC7|nr:hypothetical protein CC1G_07459 [Coprinopsis cinerea okayama7\|eukprot:XP_001832088.2 hypothetical protein CC1G_07459 [Coprinopsis cinerea okayama7\